MNLKDKIHGCLAGLAIGDALGNPTEFLTPQMIRDEYGWVDRFVSAASWHPHHIMLPGSITDDTGQALAIAHAISEDGNLTAESVAWHLLKWADEAREALPVILGPSTRKALDRLREGDSPRLTGANGTTNGAAFRAVPVGLVNFDQRDRLLEQIVEACLPTHGTTTAISGAAAVGFAVSAAIREENSVDDVIAAACEGATQGREFGKWHWATPLEKRIELAMKIVASAGNPAQVLADLYTYVGVDMLVAESVAAVFGVIKLADGDPVKAMQYGANIGGDTDTIAAIAGAICGAIHGISPFDTEMLAQVEKVNQLNLEAEADRLESIIVMKGG